MNDKLSTVSLYINKLQLSIYIIEHVPINTIDSV